MRSLEVIDSWPVGHVSAGVMLSPDDPSNSPTVVTRGDPDHRYRLASVAKPITAWAVLVAVEEGLLALDSPVGQPGCTLRHLLAHAGGYAFNRPDPIARPERRRIYSNTGIELAASAVAEAAQMPFKEYLHEAVLEPLGMTATDLRGSPAHGMWSSLADVCRFAGELLAPRLVSAETAMSATTPAFAQLAGVVPGVGRFDPCPWGLGVEIKGGKTPHWTGATNSADAFGHFGGAGTFVWVDSGATRHRRLACVALTDRAFDDWSSEALVLWPALSDAVIAEVRADEAPR